MKKKTTTLLEFSLLTMTLILSAWIQLVPTRSWPGRGGATQTRAKERVAGLGNCASRAWR